MWGFVEYLKSKKKKFMPPWSACSLSSYEKDTNF